MSRVFAGIAGDHLNASYSISLPFTISAYAKLTAGLTAQSISEIYSDATHRFGLRVSNTNFVAALHQDPTSSTATETAGTLGDLGWHVCTATFVSNTSRNAFVDGINKGTNAGTRTTLTPTSIVVGMDAGGANRFNGKIAHLAIWGGTVSDADIATLASVSPNMVRPDILLDYWPLQSNNASEPSYGSRGTILSVTGTTFDTDDPVLNANLIQPMFFNRKQMFYV